MKKTKTKIHSPLKFQRMARNKKGNWWNNMKTHRLNVIVASLAFVMLVGNLVVLNMITAKGYAMKKAESKLAELKNENQRLSLSLSDQQSMDNLLSEVDKLGLVESKSVSYITMQSTEMALK